MEEEQFALRSRPAFITLGAHACWKLAATQGHIIHAEAMFSGGLLPADLHGTVGLLQDAYLCPEIWVSLIQTTPQDVLMLKAQGSQILPPAGGPSHVVVRSHPSIFFLYLGRVHMTWNLNIHIAL